MKTIREKIKRLGNNLSQKLFPRANPQESLSSETYRLSAEKEKTQVDQCFDQLRTAIFGALQDQRVTDGESSLMKSPLLFTERGKLDSGRSYFYLKPKGEAGWLFERSGPGWTISRCEKIADQNLMLRERDAWDVVALYAPQLQRSSMRVKSHRAGEGILSFPIYEKMMVDAVIRSAVGEETSP